jgi:hypothetical protein
VARTMEVTRPEDARERLATLEEELAGLPGRIAAAKAAGDRDAWFELMSREEFLPAELGEARIAVLRLDVEEAWTVAEALDVEEIAAYEAHQAASEASRAFAGQVRRDEPQEDWLYRTAEVRRLAVAAENARIAHMTAEQSLAVQLVAVEAIEDALAAAGGTAPYAANGLRARPGVLVSNVVLRHPEDLNASGFHENERPPVTFKAGERPPRWAARQMARAPHLWAAAK